MERINKYIASCGICSRRKAEEYILSGKALVNGKIVTNLATNIDDSDVVTVCGKVIKKESKYVYIMLNKPNGYVTTNEEQFGRKCTLDLIKESVRVFPIGRLDMYTEGLLLFTNDGELANRLMHPKNKIEKTYVVDTNTKISNDMILRLENGVDIGGYITKSAKVKKLSESKLQIVISEGKNRQVRKMCEAVKINVLNLKRTKIGDLELGDLSVGKYRYLTDTELNYFIKK